MAKSRKLAGDELRNYALKLLAARARSSGELRRLLARRAAVPGEVEAILGSFKDSGYLNDQKFARSYAAFRIENQKLGSRRVERELQARYVAPAVAAKAIEDAYRDVSETELVARHIQHRVKNKGVPRDQKELASLYRRLLGLGFSPAVIVKELRAISKTHVDLPEEEIPEGREDL